MLSKLFVFTDTHRKTICMINNSSHYNQRIWGEWKLKREQGYVCSTQAVSIKISWIAYNKQWAYHKDTNYFHVFPNTYPSTHLR